MDALELAYRETREKRDDLKSQWLKEHRARLKEFEDVLCAELDAKYKDRVRRAEEEARAAEDAWNRRKVELAAEAKHPYPLGTIMVEWRWNNAVSNATSKNPASRELTGRKGVLEIITPESEHPSSWSDWKRARVGDLVIRSLKSDGKPGRSYLGTNRTWDLDHWVPEGTDLCRPDIGWPKGEA